MDILDDKGVSKLSAKVVLKGNYSFNVIMHSSMGFMPSCTTSWTSASSLFPVCHYWSNWLIQVCLTSVVIGNN